MVACLHRRSCASAWPDASADLEARPFRIRERNAATYQVLPYLMADMVTEIPWMLLQIVIWAAIIWFAPPVLIEPGPFFLFIVVLVRR